jgi:hypothetical protein
MAYINENLSNKIFKNADIVYSYLVKDYNINENSITIMEKSIRLGPVFILLRI